MAPGVRKPDFRNMLAVLDRKKPPRPVLFELFLNKPLYERLAGRTCPDDSPLEYLKLVTEAFAAAGYDYVSTHACDMHFSTAGRHMEKTVSLNEGFVITDRASFRSYDWPDPDACDYSRLGDIASFLPEGMKLMAMGPGGVLENVIALTGYENLCYLLFDDEALAGDMFDAVGERLVRYYVNALRYGSVGMVMSNDDWGFKTQTFLPPEQMRKYVFPWHKRIVDLAHEHNRPALLHSCGYAGEIMEDIIALGFDGKHSYEDIILPVEECYRRWGGRIAILGGMDVDFLIKSDPAAIRSRCRDMLALTEEKGGYALGSGNSIPEYIPYEKYMAMIGSVE